MELDNIPEEPPDSRTKQYVDDLPLNPLAPPYVPAQEAQGIENAKQKTQMPCLQQSSPGCY